MTAIIHPTNSMVKESTIQRFMGDSIFSIMVNSVAAPLASSIEIIDFVPDPAFLKKFKKWIGMSSDDEWDKYLSSYLDSYNISSEKDKFDFLKKLLKAIE